MPRSENPTTPITRASALAAAIVLLTGALLTTACTEPANPDGSPAPPPAGMETTGPRSDAPTADSSQPDADADAAPRLGQGETIPVRIAGERFQLDPALDFDSRLRGLGGVAEIPERAGMIFAFPFSQRLEFVMRDCLVPIDVAFLDATGRVLAMHTMPIEPRDPDESDGEYDRRLARYPSTFPARFAVEVRAGLLDELGVSIGDVIDFDHDALKARAR